MFKIPFLSVQGSQGLWWTKSEFPIVTPSALIYIPVHRKCILANAGRRTSSTEQNKSSYHPCIGLWMKNRWSFSSTNTVITNWLLNWVLVSYFWRFLNLFCYNLTIIDTPSYLSKYYQMLNYSKLRLNTHGQLKSKFTHFPLPSHLAIQLKDKRINQKCD